MAYVIWRVVMKKYSSVRLGLHKVPGLPSVTPTGRHALTYDEESWKPKSDDPNADHHASKSKESSPDEIGRTSETRQSKTKRVKNYLKKCKHALGRTSNSEQSSSSENQSSSWFIDKKLEEVLNESEIRELDDVFEKVHVNTNLKNDFSDKCRVACVVDVKSGGAICEDVVQDNSRTGCDLEHQQSVASNEPISSPLLSAAQEQVDDKKHTDEEAAADKENTEVKGEVATLVDRYFGELYGNYKNSRKCLVRQARDLLVCEYHGSLQRFESEFCIPGAKLLKHLKDKNADSGTAPLGWPLCLGSSGVVIQLGPFSPTLVRHTDCYLCLRGRSAPGLEVALIWRKSAQIHCQTFAEFRNPLQNFDEIMCSALTSVMDLENVIDDCDGVDLPELLQNLLVSVEHAIERVPLDDLANPCPQCLQYVPLNRQEQESDNTTCSCQCSCRMPEATVLKKDTSIQTSPMFEFAGPIPHIDSDEDEDKESIKSGSSGNRSHEVVQPKRITDIPEKHLMVGINLPGTVDTEGRPIILCYAECIARAGLNKYEIAKVLLYYASIPCANETENGFTIFLLAETDAQKALDLLDKSIALVAYQMNVTKFVIWKPNARSEPRYLNSSRLKGIVVNDESSLEIYVAKDQAPASCGGSCTHDQLEWVEFFKQLEPFLASCHSAGRALLGALSQLRSEEIPVQVNRRFLNHQCRQITKALQLDSVQRLRRDGTATLQSLEERTQWISASRDVRRQASFANTSFHTVDRVAKRLDQLAAERKERLKELARLKALEEEASDLLAWIRKVGDETLRSHAILLRTAVDVASVKDVEKDFEKFYFDAMRQIDKAGDLVEESNNIAEFKGKNWKENANKLKTQVKNFTERLEEARENLEDCSRCFQLLEKSTDGFEDGSKELEDFKKLGFKTGNEKLAEVCKVMQSQSDLLQYPSCDSDDPNNQSQYILAELTATSTPIKSQLGQVRRRSVSSIAFIYKCNHHAAGVSCSCYESDTENSVSYKLKKKYMQSLQNCGCGLALASGKETLDRKTSLTLDGIKEVRESVENLLEKYDKTDSGLSGCGRCDSGVSTAENSVGDDSVYKKKLQRTCSCQFYSESCTLCSTGSSSTGSNQDHTENQQDSITEEGSDGFGKSGSDDIEEEHFSDERRKVPPVPANSHLHCHASNLHLPTDLFDSSTDPKTQKTLLYIMREMIHTERDYVKSLDYIIENYIPELMREDIPQALRGQRNVIFGNVEKIYEFHGQHFLRELEQCENCPLQVGQIFLKHHKKFYLYALYNKNKPKSDSLMSEYGTVFFKSKQLQLGDKMDLASYVLKPVQRMGKYALLLQQMMKACPALPPGSSERLMSERDDLKQAEEMVRFQLRHGNDLLAMDSIRDCDVNLKEQGRLMRQNEFLVWEGRTGKKTLRQVFLFEDLILFSKARRFPDRKNLDLFIYKNSIKLTDIGLTAKIGDSPTKFEIWFRKRKPNDTFTIQATSEEVKKAWAEELSQLLWKQAIKNREVRMAEMSSMGIGNKPCLDIRPSVDQISDRSISFAQLTRTAPRFRNSIVGPVTELCRSAKRPHSVISMSSISSSSTSSGGSIGCGVTTPTSVITLPGFESVCGSPKACRRSGTLNSQCSTESGIIADISLGAEDCHDNSQISTHWPLEKSNSQHSTSSSKSNTTTPTQSDDTQVTIYHVPDDLPVNI